jgi:hypothetical protein
MLFFKTALMIGLVVFFSTAEVCAAEVMLKIACIEAGELDAFRVTQEVSLSESPAVDYKALAAALTGSVSGTAENGSKAALSSAGLVAAEVRDAPAVLQALFPEQGRLIGRRSPGGANGWYTLMLDFSAAAQTTVVELSVEHAVLDSLATGFDVGSLHERPIQQYTHGMCPVSDAVFTAGYSFFSQQLGQGNAREWLETIMPLKNGIGVVALRRAGSETRTDTVIIRIDARSLPQSISGRTEALVVLGWDHVK